MIHTYQISAPDFTAKFVLSQTGDILLIDPIIRYMSQWTLISISSYCSTMGWVLKHLDTSI